MVKIKSKGEHTIVYLTLQRSNDRLNQMTKIK